MCGFCIERTAKDTRDFCPPERVPISWREVMPCRWWRGGTRGEGEGGRMGKKEEC